MYFTSIIHITPTVEKSHHAPRFVLEADQWWEIMLNVRPQAGGYDPMGGGTVWSQGGLGGQPEVLNVQNYGKCVCFFTS